MRITLEFSDREVQLLSTALISQINHYQDMVDGYREEMGSPDCAGYLDCLVDLEGREGRQKKEYEKLYANIKSQVTKKALEEFLYEKAMVFRELGNSARRYLLYVGSNIREVYRKLEDSLVK